MTICIRCYVAGRVQGVWFRGTTQAQAAALGLTGYARNLSDGRVEVLACGDPAALATLKAWLWQGPPQARVEQVECAATDESPPNDFSIG